MALKASIQVNNSHHMQAIIDGQARVVAFIDAATGELNVQVYAGLRSPSKRRIPVASAEGASARRPPRKPGRYTTEGGDRDERLRTTD